MKFKNVNAELARRGMTKEQLREEIIKADYDISYSSLCRLLRGESEISFGLAGTIAKILECDVNYLFGEED